MTDLWLSHTHGRGDGRAAAALESTSTRVVPCVPVVVRLLPRGRVVLGGVCRSSCASGRLHYGSVFISFVLILPHEHFCGAKFFKSLLSILEKSYVNQSCSYNFVDQKPKRQNFQISSGLFRKWL